MRDPAPPAPIYLDHAAARRIVVGVLLTMLLSALDQVAVATALPTIAENLGDVENMSWVITANLLCATAVTPLYGKLSDIYGRRTMLLIGIGVYAAGSLACALAPTMLALILARVLQGLGGGGLIPLVQTIIGDVAAPRDRPRYQTYTSSTFIIATMGGPLLGGFIAEHLHWSLIFWINLPLCAIAYLLSYKVLQRLPRHDRPHRLDMLGMFLMVGAAIALMVALTWGGRRYSWDSLYIMALLAASATLWAVFALRVMTAREPFIPLSVLRDGAMRVGTAAAFFAVGTMTALTITMPLYAQLALGLSVSESGWAIVALQGAATVGSIVAGRLLVRFAHYKRVPLVGLLLSIAALIPLAISPTGLSASVALGLVALAGFGLGPTFPFTIVVVQNTVALHELGIATGTMNFFRALGATFIVAGFGAIVLAGAPVTRDVSAAAVLAGPQAARIVWLGICGGHLVSDDCAGFHSDVGGAPSAWSFATRGFIAALCPSPLRRAFLKRYERQEHQWVLSPDASSRIGSHKNFKPMSYSSRKPNKSASAQSHAPLGHADMRNIFYGLMLGMFLSALNQTIVATALPTIGRDFGDFENLSWVIISYLLSSTVVSPLYGKLSDIHGRRAMMLVAIGMFIAGSIVAAAASDMVMLIAGRTLQGVGGGGIVPLTQTTIADMITPRERGRYQAYMGTSWIAAGVAGPALGGIIAEHLHWSAIFWLNVPFGLVAALLTHRAMKRLPRHERPHQLDIVGAALMIAAASLFLIALTSGGTRVPWVSPTIFVLMAISLVISLAFVWWLKRAPEPFLPLAVLRNPVMRAGTAATSLTLGAVLGITIYMPLYFQVVHKLSATHAGFALIPIVVMTTPGSMLSGRSMLHLRRYKVSAIAGVMIAIASVAALVVWPAMPLYGVIVALTLIGFGVGTVYPVMTVSIQNAVPGHQVGTATGAMNFFRALASTLAVAIMGAILLAGLGATPERGTGVELLVETASAAGVDMAAVFRWIFVAADVFLALALVAILLMEERPLRGPASNAAPVSSDAPPAPAE